MSEATPPGTLETGQNARAAPRRSIAYQRPKTTKASVLLADRIADKVITIGGLLVILAVFAIMVFLVAVVVPLFTGVRTTGEASISLGQDRGQILGGRVDEYQTVAIGIETTGKVELFHLATGKPLAPPAFDLGGKRPSAFAATLDGQSVIFGFDDGTVRLGTVAAETQILPAEQIPAGLTRLNETDQTDGSAVWRSIPNEQARRVALALALEAPRPVAPPGAAIVAADYRVRGSAETGEKTFVTLDSAGTIRLSRGVSRQNLMTGETRTEVQTAELAAALPADAALKSLLLAGDAARLYVAATDGRVFRFDVRDFRNPRLVETVDVLDGAAQLTAFGFLNGEASLIVGGSDGSVAVWFGTSRPDSERAVDKIELTRVHQLPPHAAPVTRVSTSLRSRMFATGDATGEVRLHHATSARTLLTLPGAGQPLAALALSPRDDAILAVDEAGAGRLWQIHAPHPETTLGTLFGPVWYEGYPGPGFTWQSTAATDAAEPKLSLVPVIFGTIKGALYALVFAVPIALLAAVYTSEFLHPRVRAVVKPVMELMATLPSVVIGFVVALVLSPIIETWIAAVVFAFAVVPLSLIAAAHLWQLLPNETQIRLQGLPKFALFFLVIILAAWAATASGPLVEAVFFGGAFGEWSARSGGVDSPSSGPGSGMAFWGLLIFPLVVLILKLLVDRLLGDHWRLMLRRRAPQAAGLLAFLRWSALVIAGGAIAFGLASLIAAGAQEAAAGASGGWPQLAARLDDWFDPRGGVFADYAQRNAMIAALGIGFALIPIVYTISDDALNAVPEHLRAASLACGATRWQTARRVIVPTAMSGIFSAIMIGMGRAVGETMIVVMATGNTPVLDWNLFSGLRALSANITVELPEAVKDSTLYRTLFLCALTLFVMTFIVNTLAELVRQRFRKRTASL